MINLIVFGEAKAQGRARAFIMHNRRTNQNRIGFYDPDRSKDWKNDIRYAFLKKYDRFKLIEDAIEMEVIFFLAKPKSKPKAVIHHTTKPDLDNLLKAVKDALQGYAYRNDSQIVFIQSFKFYCFENTRPQVQIRIKPAADDMGMIVRTAEG